jgi:glutathione S-transferase
MDPRVRGDDEEIKGILTIQGADVLKVWGRAGSINVQKVMWTVGELNLPHERIDAGGAFGLLDTGAFGALNPHRKVPVIDDKGFALWESGAIVRYLARKYGQGTLLPDNEHDIARADSWMDWAATALYGDIVGTVFMGLVRTPEPERDSAAIAAGAKRAGEKLSVLDGVLAKHPYIVGGRLSIADIGVGVQMYRYFTLPVERPKLPNVERWYAQLTERPAYRTHVMIDYMAGRAR